MITTTKPKAVAVVAVLALLIGACGGGSDSAVASEATTVPAPTSSTAPATTEPAVVPDPTATPVPPTPEPTPEPTEVPPTVEPTPEPTEVPPTPQPTPEPTVEPTPEPTPEPTVEVVETTPDPGDAGDAAGEQASSEEPVPPAAPAVDGALIFSQSCSSCHAADGSGTGRGPSIIGIGQFFTPDDSVLVNLVTNGGTNMPSFGARLSSAEIDAVVDYVVVTFQ